jgi:hypothetical protein
MTITTVPRRPLFLALLLAGSLALSGSGCESHSPHASATDDGPCRKDADCDDSGGICVDGSCVSACDTHFDCAATGLCKAGPKPYCAPGAPAKNGQFYQHCSAGAAECDADAGFLCASAGLGDIDAYCTKDCSGDGDCPSGFRCGTASATPCANACGVQGKNTAGCAPVAEIGEGKRFECAMPLGVIRHVCQLRSFCDPCDTDDDCLGTPGQICAKDKSGEKICTQRCDPSVDACPWGDASECGLFDAELGQYTCAHRFGACHGHGNGCEPCRDNGDCAPKGFCTHSSFTGEQYCIDLSLECDCGDDSDASGTCEGHGCPNSAGDLPLTCASGAAFDGTAVSHRCIGANSAASSLSSPRTGCWAPR